MKYLFFLLLFPLNIDGESNSAVIFRSHGFDYIICHLPQGYKTYFVINGSCSTIIFEYKDSCQIYISTSDEYSPNRQNILLTQHDEKTLFRINWQLNMSLYERFVLASNNDSTLNSFLNTASADGNYTMREFLSIGSDTIDLGGETEDNKYWRDLITPDGYCYGYINVEESAKSAFDKAVSSIVRTTQIDDFPGEIFIDK